MSLQKDSTKLVSGVNDTEHEKFKMAAVSCTKYAF